MNRHSINCHFDELSFNKLPFDKLWQGFSVQECTESANGYRPPHLKPVPPHFTFGPPVATYIQYCILEMWSPLSVFGPSWFLTPLVLNPGHGPARNTLNALPSINKSPLTQNFQLILNHKQEQK